MKIDFIFYSDNYAVGVFYTDKLLIPGIALLRKYSTHVSSEILKDLQSRCHYLINNKKITDYLKNKYNVGDPVDESDWELLAKIFIMFYPKQNLLAYVSGDDNFEELAKCSDTEFATALFSVLLEDNLDDEFKIPKNQKFLVAKVLAERGVDVGYIYVASCYYSGSFVNKDKALALKYFEEAEKLGINSKYFIELLDKNIN